VHVDHPTGLTSAQVAERVARGQVNEVGERTSRSIGEIVRANVLTRFNAILGALFVLVMTTGSWADGLFGNVVSGDSIFARRPHMTTTKALLINTAAQWEFSGEGHDLTRVHQGWGRADLRRLYDLKDRILVVDEQDVLPPQSTKVYSIEVAEGDPVLKVTLVYADPPAVPGAAVARVNDLTLKVTSPTGEVYFGNYGLREGLWSKPGGEPNTVDTVENVFVDRPAAGSWRVEVRTDEVNQDGHVETEELDADFALVVSGPLRAPVP